MRLTIEMLDEYAALNARKRLTDEELERWSTLNDAIGSTAAIRETIAARDRAEAALLGALPPGVIALRGTVR